MKTHLRTAISAAMLGALLASGCENMTATENALIAAGLAGAATGIAMGTTGVPVGSTLPVSLGAAAGAGALAYGVSKMQVSRDQRMFAEQRGQMLVAQAQKRGATDIPRYILVDTMSASPTPGRPVMLFDTASGRVASNRVYYVDVPAGPYGYVEAPPGFMRPR